MSPIHDATDNDLRTLIYKFEYAIAKFVDESCPVCKELAPYYKQASEDPAYKDVLFLRVQAHENPVSSKEVALSGTPFVATYRRGKLIECGLITTKKEMKDMLDRIVREALV